MLYCCLNSFDKGADNKALLSIEEAEKWAFLDLDLEEETSNC